MRDNKNEKELNQPVFVGIDIGSVTTKAVVTNEKEEILTFSLILTSYDRQQSGADVLELALREAGRPRDDVAYIVATGYGRRSISFANEVLPEIVCHAKGTRLLFPSARTIIDIGGQDSKVIQLDKDGGVTKFEMNDKCAAGTGRFLEVLAERILKVPITEFGTLSLKSTEPLTLSSICTVFAESEIISLLSEHKTKENIAYSMCISIAKRVIAMGIGGQINYEEPIVFSGGVAKNNGVVKAIEENLSKKVIIPEKQQITAALGAAIFAKERHQ
ncbi:MAG TPA: 2-hydroxyglutaryl-CoA dehydratase [Dehalococcoidia bacterium]|nr:2-hydroxyglutaryl-CoA dehydratase [Dehalococcoidia bacterium]